ncbi:hypothetical protein [Planococcus maitriensis]|uniref:Uncharacterized protein n=1 Tax=Planococcus maitriensis TaxID=221799 RepID=A0A365KA44_9BACL|nr:hypothetical protein [Planococcus maitriensis]RAZ69625.1 hypothetical protein DP119_02915 [Planococcus maitriensis]
MTDFEELKAQLEAKHQKEIGSIISDLYIGKDLGPAVGAKELGIPRRAFVYFVQQCGLQSAKYELIKKKALSSISLAAAAF